ncbi:hypothetical protein ACFPPD_06715 [Cohnella suwonensis]|uniref:Copper amine oxidase-like N-terminal domain-containing protein n=1 Tax=Cohnella suwonensis TaxID=696072 RepID=A0ABW0LV35_9BACL
MRKYIVGFVAGLIVASALPAYGAVSSLIGKKVTKEIQVKMDSETIGTAIVVEGRSYLPVRSLSDALDLTVQVNAGGVNLVTENIAKELEIKKTGRANVVIFRDKSLVKVNDLQKYIVDLDTRLENEKTLFASMGADDPKRSTQAEIITSLEQEKEKNDQKLVELKSELDKFNKMIEERDAEIAELEARLQAQ